MDSFVVSTDSTCDLPADYLQEHRIPVIPLLYQLDDITYGAGTDLDDHEFYEMMRNGKMPTTMAANPESVRSILEPILAEGKDVLHLAFSSGLSSSYSAAAMAAQELSEQYPDRKVIVIDSLCASLGEGLFVYKAVEKRDAGMSITEVAHWLTANRQSFCHIFTVDDLFHLFRGGRVNRATAIIGSLASIKPILHVDFEGHLIPIGKVRGRKKSLAALVDRMDELAKGFEKENTTVFISHGDCLEDAQYVADLVRDRFGIQDIMVNMICPTIGAHSGPGTVALFFMGQHR